MTPYPEQFLTSTAEEAAYEIRSIHGAPPPWLRGSYYVNGPARFQRGDVRCRNWLDGDGMVCALHFRDDGIHFVSRFVRTHKLLQEEAAGRFLYRSFGMAFEGSLLRRNLMIEAPMNVNVLRYDGRLLALGEQTLPVELHPESLDTYGIYDFHGSLNEVSPFAAHPKLDSRNGHLLNFGVSFATSGPTLHVYEFDGAGKKLWRARHSLDHPYSIHDMGFTPDFLIFHLSPLLLDFSLFLERGNSVVDSLLWRPELGSKLLLVPRGGFRQAPSLVDVGSKYCLHLVNCHQQSGKLVVDLIEFDHPLYPDYQPMPDLFSHTTGGYPRRIELALPSLETIGETRADYHSSPDFPSVEAGRASLSCDRFWALGFSRGCQPGRKFFDQLVRIDWDRPAEVDLHQAPEGQFLGGEPVYIAHRKEPSEAVILVQYFDNCSDQAGFLLFDANCLRAGPICRLDLATRICPGFHAFFQPS